MQLDPGRSVFTVRDGSVATFTDVHRKGDTFAVPVSWGAALASIAPRAFFSDAQGALLRVTDDMRVVFGDSTYSVMWIERPAGPGQATVASVDGATVSLTEGASFSNPVNLQGIRWSVQAVSETTVTISDGKQNAVVTNLPSNRVDKMTSDGLSVSGYSGFRVDDWVTAGQAINSPSTYGEFDVTRMEAGSLFRAGDTAHYSPYAGVSKNQKRFYMPFSRQGTSPPTRATEVQIEDVTDGVVTTEDGWKFLNPGGRVVASIGGSSHSFSNPSNFAEGNPAFTHYNVHIRQCDSEGDCYASQEDAGVYWHEVDVPRKRNEEDTDQAGDPRAKIKIVAVDSGTSDLDGSPSRCASRRWTR